jgi:hypothetical protein
MKIILSQRIDTKSDYDDIPFSTYHFPKRYRNQIKAGDRFLYYQGDRSKKENRYYFGCGVIGTVEPEASGDHYYAEILEGRKFSKNVPIYSPTENGFLESIGFEQVRNKPTPSWQNSIRKISDDAFLEILRLGDVEDDAGKDSSLLESETDALSILKHLNARYAKTPPKERDRVAQKYLDRGSAVTNALKALLGAKCQICEWMGFQKKNSKECFIEAHHLVQVANKEDGSLCTDNIILVCPNCHREIHYGQKFTVASDEDHIDIVLSSHKARIKRNTMKTLEAKS